MMTISKKRFFQTLGRLALILAAASLYTCEQVRDYCRPTGAHYDPSCEFCFAGKAYPLCADGSYNPLTEGCTERENKRGTRCADESFVLRGTPCGGYTLSVGAAPEIGGTVAGNHLSKAGFDKDDQVTMFAMPAEGYKFIGWAGLDSDSGEAVSLRMDGDKSLIAMFSSKTATLVAAAFPREGGKVSIIESGATGQEVTEGYKDGDVVTVKATPEPGYTFKSWSGASTSTSQETSVTMEGGKTLVAIFEPYEYTLTVNAYPKEGGAVFIDGTVLEAGKSKAGAGAQITALARPADGYVFDGWSGASDSKDEFVTIDVASGNMTLVANFRKGGGTGTSATYTLKVNANPANGGTVSPTSKSNISAGTVIDISATPSSGDYAFKNWTVASGWAEFANANDASTTVTLSSDATVMANFDYTGSGDPPGTDPTGKYCYWAPNSNNGFTASCWPIGGPYSVEEMATEAACVASSGRVIDDCGNPPPQTGEGTLTYGDQTYRTVTIGNQTWMAQNLNYQTLNDSWCYDSIPSNCAKYGRLYTWEAANSACAGLGGEWRLPTSADWDNLVDYAGGREVVGKKLKAKSGWDSNGNGTDDYGFSALPGGSRDSDGYFYSVGYGGFWWSATEYGSDRAYYRYMYGYYDGVIESIPNKSDGFSVRCVGVVKD